MCVCVAAVCEGLPVATGGRLENFHRPYPFPSICVEARAVFTRSLFFLFVFRLNTVRCVWDKYIERELNDIS